MNLNPPGDAGTNEQALNRRLPNTPNKLADETSPYLLQHAHNPVDWYPWSPEALERAQREDKPIFLSIGYSACHWCHVMERESFEDESIAALMNENFVCIKVDREERPDLDDLYMAAVQLLNGQGGWPMSVWLTPDLKPFFGGTYFPPEDHYGRPGFRRVLERLSEVYRTRREDIERGGTQMLDQIASFARIQEGAGLLTTGLLRIGADSLVRIFDPAQGGFGSAPKFPHSMGLQLLLRQYQRTGDLSVLRAVTVTLDAMARGGIYDHLGGGFHRYSTDARWLVPHFEKMLYDEALLVPAYLEAYQVTGSPLYKEVVQGTIDYVLSGLTAPEGGFFCTLDADSEGEEGKYYVWTQAEVLALLGKEEGALFCRAYDVDEVGNFEGQSILHPVVDHAGLAAWTGRPRDEIAASLARSRAVLLESRSHRVPPARDEKILTSWNGLMIAAASRAGAALGEPRYVKAAAAAADFILARLVRDGRLLHAFKDGRARFPGYLEDYSHLIAGLIDLHQATLELRWLREAERLAEIMIADFADPDGPGFFYTTEAHRDVAVRMKSAQDGSTPSGNSMAVCVLLRLGRLTGKSAYEERAERTLRGFADLMERAPGAFHQMFLALDLYLGPRQEIVVVGPARDTRTVAFVEAVQRRFLPRAVLLLGDGAEAAPAPLEGKTLVSGSPAAYVCRDYTCEAPVVSVEQLEAALTEAQRP